MSWLWLRYAPPEILYFLISLRVIAALPLPWLGDIIIIITTSPSCYRQIILLGPFFFFIPPHFSFFILPFFSPSLSLFFFAAASQWRGKLHFFTKPFCCLYCDSGHTPSHSPSLSYEYPTIGVMVNTHTHTQSEQSKQRINHVVSSHL